MNNHYLYSARDISTGELVSDITNPKKKYWQQRSAAVKAINNYNSRTNWYGRSLNHGKLELVTWKLEEVKANALVPELEN